MSYRLTMSLFLLAAGCGDDAPGTDDSTTSSGTDGSTGTPTSSTSLSTSSTDGTSSDSSSSDPGTTEIGSESTGLPSTGDTSSGETSSGDGTGSSSGTDTGTMACDCNENEYCDWPDDACGRGEEGICALRPLACDDIYDPVCGCDGQTWANDCDAAGAGVDVDYAGECEAAACACGAGQWCPLPVGECDSDEGVCEDIPNDPCPEIYAPVCGCDGQTYSSDCVAANAGMNIAYEGEC